MEVVFDLRASGENGLRGKFRLLDCGGFLRLDVGFGMDSIKIWLKKDALDDLVLELTENFPKRQENEARKRLEETLDELKRSGIDPRELAKTLRLEQLIEEKGEEKPAVDPGPGYRLLQDGETLLPADEVYKKGSGVWEPTKFRSHVVGEAWLRGNVYRRKIPVAPITRPATAE